MFSFPTMQGGLTARWYGGLWSQQPSQEASQGGDQGQHSLKKEICVAFLFLGLIKVSIKGTVLREFCSNCDCAAST